MEQINCLFIGGVKDGQWMVVKEFRQYIHVPVAIPLMRVGDMSLEMKTEVYKAARLAGADTKFTVYALDGMTGDDVVAALINGYKKS